MKPKEKAIELINKYNLVVLDTALGGSNKRVKQCSLILVNEIINELNITDFGNRWNYWNEVKQEIEKL